MGDGDGSSESTMLNHGIHFTESTKYTLGVEIELQNFDKT